MTHDSMGYLVPYVDPEKCIPTMFSRDVTTVEPEIKHTVVAVSFYCFCYNCSRAAKLYREDGAEYAADGKKL